MLGKTICDNPHGFAAQFAELDIQARETTARAFMLVSPTQFSLSTETASDNRYMDLGARVDPERAAHQHATLVEAIRRSGAEVLRKAMKAVEPSFHH